MAVDPVSVDVRAVDRELASLAHGDARVRLRLGDALVALGSQHKELGFRTFGDYVRERLPLGAGWASRTRTLARRLAERPATRAALVAGRISWCMAELLARHSMSEHSTPEDEAELLDATRGMTVRAVEAALAEAGGVPEPDEDEAVRYATLDVSLSRETALALETARMGVEHLNGGSAEPGEWFACLLFEGHDTLNARMGPAAGEPDIEAAQASWMAERDRRAAWQARREASAVPIVDPIAIDEEAEVDAFDSMSLVSLDAAARRLAAELTSRDLWVAGMLSRFFVARGPEQLGYASEQQYCADRLGMARATMYAHLALWRTTRWLEALDRALTNGDVGLEQARLIARVASPDTVDAWIGRASQRTYKHLREEVEAAELAAQALGEPVTGLEPPSAELVSLYHDLERSVVSGEHFLALQQSHQADDVQTLTSDGPVDGSSDEGAEDGVQTLTSFGSGSTVRFRVRLREDLLFLYRSLAATYVRSGIPGSFELFLVANFWQVWGPAFQHGTSVKAVFDRDRHRCVSPVCSSRLCTNHHVRYRAHGGGDELPNQITVCEFCHLEGEHGGRLKVRGTADRLHWWIGRDALLEVSGRELVSA
ncbi:MAG: HNH endonuclease [Sandaracinaceae bacterium]